MTHPPAPPPPGATMAAAEAADTAGAPPRLTDRAALARARQRAARIGDRSADWAHRLVRDEVELRLAEVNRRFTHPAVVTPRPELWSGLWPDGAARIVPDEPVLDLAPAAHDLVIHAMALHWADDPVGQLAQAARALRPDGLLIAAAPGGQTLAPLRAALAQAESETAGGLSPRVLPMGEIRDLGGLLARAGLALPVADQLTQHASYRSLFHLAHELRAMGETNALDRRLRHPSRRALFLRAAELLHEAAPDPDDPERIRLAADFVFLTGWAPADSQPRPLRPGSAAMRLAEALNPRGDA